MKCVKCPLYSSRNDEIEKSESCGLFGDAWDSQFLQYDENGAVIGCYIEKCFIDRRFSLYIDELVQFAEYFRKENIK